MRFKRCVDGAGKLYGYCFHCVGCDDEHVVPTEGPTAWQFNGDVDRPTLSPSILVYERQHMTDAGVVTRPRCHSFVRDGRIEYLGDCGHALAGQTINLPELS